jgi:hypothetical protein
MWLSQGIDIQDQKLCELKYESVLTAIRDGACVVCIHMGALSDDHLRSGLAYPLYFNKS